MLSTDKEYIGTFEAGSEYVVTFDYPTDSDFNYVDFDNFDIEIEVNLNPLMMNKTYVKNINIESNVGADNIMAKFTNNSNAMVESLSFVVLFYYNGEIVGYSMDYAFDLAAGDSTTVEFYEPYDAEFNDIPYDDYEVIVNDAYSY
jgi:hypothetical protein